MIINYSELNGVKLTLFVPLLNNQIRSAILNSTSDDETKSLFTIVLCHSFIRCQELNEMLQDLVCFCSEFVDIVNLDTSDLAEVQLKIKLSL